MKASNDCTIQDLIAWSVVATKGDNETILSTPMSMELILSVGGIGNCINPSKSKAPDLRSLILMS